MSYNTISVVGLGYIGLPTAAMFASKKKTVIGVDVSQYVVDTINSGRIHIVEPELDLIVKGAVENGWLRASAATQPADVFIIAVPTPFHSRESSEIIPEPDVSYIKSASKGISSVLKSGDLIILESTSPVGTTEKLAGWLAEDRPDLTFPQTHGEDSDIKIAYCPERVLPGQVVKELIENDRIIGGLSASSSKAAIEVYKIFVEGDCMTTNARTAEMAKLTENASRDVSIAFANELSIICDELDINVWELIRLSNMHPRVNILNPGPGVGGHCIAVDPWFIVSKTPLHSQLIHTARKVNDFKPEWVCNKIMSMMTEFLLNNPKSNVNEVKIACFGLSFKADIDDLRESPAVHIVQKLAGLLPQGILAIEPNVKDLPSSFNGVELVSTEHALANAEILILLVDHKEFRNLDIKGKLILDTRGIWQS